MAAEINERFNTVVSRLHVKERYDKLSEMATNNPLKATFITVAVATCLLPTLLFIGFMASSICFGIVGLLFIEGKHIKVSL